MTQNRANEKLICCFFLVCYIITRVLGVLIIPNWLIDDVCLIAILFGPFLERFCIILALPITERPKSTKHCKLHIETMISGTHMDPKTAPNSSKKGCSNLVEFLTSFWNNFGPIFDHSGPIWTPKWLQIGPKRGDAVKFFQILFQNRCQKSPKALQRHHLEPLGPNLGAIWEVLDPILVALTSILASSSPYKQRLVGQREAFTILG